MYHRGWCHGWQQSGAEVYLKKQSKNTKRKQERKKEKRKRVDRYVPIILVTLIIRAFSIFILCKKLCCIPCNSRAADCSDVTGGSIVRKVGHEGKNIIFIVPLVGGLKSNGSSSSLPGLRGEVIDLSQVLHM